MDPNIKITKKFTMKFGSNVINGQYFHRKTGLETMTIQGQLQESVGQNTPH